jgi:hypothetical protein
MTFTISPDNSSSYSISASLSSEWHYEVFRDNWKQKTIFVIQAKDKDTADRKVSAVASNVLSFTNAWAYLVKVMEGARGN